MKVICINDKGYLTNIPIAKEGLVFTVVDESIAPNGIDHYEFEEIPGYYYAKSRFVPLSDIDETTFERNYNVDWFDEIFIQPLKKS